MNPGEAARYPVPPNARRRILHLLSWGGLPLLAAALAAGSGPVHSFPENAARLIRPAARPAGRPPHLLAQSAEEAFPTLPNPPGGAPPGGGGMIGPGAEGMPAAPGGGAAAERARSTQERLRQKMEQGMGGDAGGGAGPSSPSQGSMQELDEMIQRMGRAIREKRRREREKGAPGVPPPGAAPGTGSGGLPPEVPQEGTTFVPPPGDVPGTGSGGLPPEVPQEGGGAKALPKNPTGNVPSGGAGGKGY